MNLQNALSATMLFNTALFLIKEIISQEKKWGKGLMIMDFTAFTMFLYHFEAAGLIE